MKHAMIPPLLVVLAAPVRAQQLPVELESDRKPGIVTHGNCLLKGGTILTVVRGFMKGDILVSNGKIASIGTDIQAPSGTTVIQAAGKFITPGLIDAHSHISEEENNEWADSITAEVRIHDVLDPNALSIYQKLAGGVTSSLVLHGSANPIGGQSVVIKLKYRHPVEDLIVSDAPRMIKFALGENVKQSNQGPGEVFKPRFPNSRMGVEAVYRRAFAEARRYIRAWDQYNADRKKTPDLVPPRRDLRLEALADILRGRIWVQCHSYRADEMLMMLRLSKEFGFKLAALQHGLEAYRIAPEIAASGAGVSTFADAWAYKVEAYEAIPYNAALCMRAGIVTSVNSDSAGGMSPLNLEAAKSLKYGGLNEAECLRLVTLNPAIQLGIAHRTGSLEVGKDADIAVWEGHPLSVFSRCVMTLVEGEVLFQRRDAFGLNSQASTAVVLPHCPGDHLSIPTLPAARAYAIVGATIHPISGPDIPSGVIVVDGSRITSVGTGGRIPKDAVVVRAKGLHVYPGLIDAGSQLGLTEIEAVRATVDTAEGGEIQPDLQALTAVNPASEHLAVTRANGITTALTRPSAGASPFGGAGGLIAGQSAVINLAGWTPDLMKIENQVALHVSFPEGTSGLPTAAKADMPPEALKRLKDAEKKQMQRLKDYFERAKRYAASRAANPALEIDASLEAMTPYVAGKKPVFFHVSSSRGIKGAVKFAEEMGIKPVIAGGDEAWKVAKLLTEKNIPVVYHPPSGFTEIAPIRDFDPYDAPLAAPALLQKAGVKFCFESGDAPLAKSLPSTVGMCCAFGLPRDSGIRALTLGAAEILGVADRLGSLQPGKLANVIITDGDPLEIATNVHYLFINGRPVSTESKHTRLYQLYQKRLIER